MAPLVAAAAKSGAEAVEAADVVAAACGPMAFRPPLPNCRRASLTAELSDANAAASGGGCCRCGLLESPDIGDSNRDRDKSGREQKPRALFFSSPFFISLFQEEKNDFLPPLFSFFLDPQKKPSSR